MPRTIASIFGAFFLLTAIAGKPAMVQSAPLSDKAIADYSRDVFFGTADQRTIALRHLVARGQADVAPALVMAMRYFGADAEISDAFKRLTGNDATDWFDGMLWQEANPEIAAHPSYRDLKIELFSRLDREFLRFVGGERSLPENMEIRLEEITWGGVVVDGIPSLDDPELIDSQDADYLLDDDLVFGVSINGDVRAYPLRIMGWHEMFNEVIGGVPVALAYCTLCGAGILFETQVEGQEAPFVFGSSGFLYRSNKLMFDRRTDSLWNQFTGEPVSGPLVGSGIKLKIRPVAITSWKNWKSKNPDTKVLSLNTGHNRNYDSGVVYNTYFTSPDLMFPAVVARENEVKRKEYVFGIRDFGAAKAWPLDAFQDVRVINDRVGNLDVVLIGDASTRTVRAYERNGLSFMQSEQPDFLTGPGGQWKIGENRIVGPDGTRLPRVAGHVAYWFAWDGYLGVKSELYSDASVKSQ
ncbi:DUF3179 domain-containing protein [Pelagibius sp. Alg239-R121]|uniref:DUF3179 domain-containing protein n=1 Tax=Pelagibius sp. Alg239-R121 TaxID=2993448 RepID=UPI0024A6A036|nr:DUF3179 domain-containing protein [Pelagibius sp. Alg239-R121]